MQVASNRQDFSAVSHDLRPRTQRTSKTSPSVNLSHVLSTPTIGSRQMEGIEWWRGFEQKFQECGAVTFFLARIKHRVSVLSRARVLGDFLSVIDRYPGESLLGVHFCLLCFLYFLWSCIDLGTSSHNTWLFRFAFHKSAESLESSIPLPDPLPHQKCRLSILFARTTGL